MTVQRGAVVRKVRYDGQGVDFPAPDETVIMELPSNLVPPTPPVPGPRRPRDDHPFDAPGGHPYEAPRGPAQPPPPTSPRVPFHAAPPVPFRRGMPEQAPRHPS